MGPLSRRVSSCRRRRRSWGTVGLTVILWTMVCLGGEPRQFTTDQGLPNNNVYALYQDSDGFLWWGLEGGLARYDGYQIKIYAHDPLDSRSLSHDDVSAVTEDDQGNLWVGVWGGMLNRKRPGQEGFDHFGPPKGMLSQHVSSLVFIDDSLWIGTDQGLFRTTDQGRRFEQFLIRPNPGDPGNQVWTLAATRNHLWIGTEGGLYGLNLETNHIDSVTAFTEASDLNEIRIRSLASDGVQRLWIGHDQGLSRILVGVDRVEFFPQGADQTGPSGLPVQTLTYVRGDNILVGSRTGGLDQFDDVTKQFIPIELQADGQAGVRDIRAVLLDRARVLWIGLRGGGVVKIDRKPKKFRRLRFNPSVPDGLTHPVVNTVWTDTYNHMWIGSDIGLDRYDGQRRRLQTYRHDPEAGSGPPPGPITALTESDDGKIWVGAEGGLRYIQDDAFIEVAGDLTQQDAFELRNITTLTWRLETQQLWVGSRHGLAAFSFDQDQNATVRYFQVSADPPNALREDHVTALAFDDDGGLWIGFQARHLQYLEPGQNRMRNFDASPTEPKGPPPNGVTALHTFYGFTWIGFEGGGLSRYNPVTDEFQTFTRADGLPSNNIRGIVDDRRENLWISTDKGLTRFNPAARDFRTYDVFDGLQSNRFVRGAAHRSEMGDLFFGGVNGLNIFTPRQVADNLIQPLVTLTAVEIPTRNNQNYAGAQTINLQTSENLIRFKFSSMDFTIPEKNQYRYMLEPFDDDWSPPTSDHTVTYTNLHPGSYTFKLMASNNDGVWNETPVTRRIIVSGPWYQSRTAKVLYGLLALLCLILLARYLKRREAVKVKRSFQEKEQQIEEQAQETRSRFLNNMSHELRTPLTAVVGYTELIEEIAEESNDLGPYRDDLEKIKTAAYQQLELVTNLLELSKLEAQQTEIFLSDFDVIEEVTDSLKPMHTRLSDRGNKLRILTTETLGVMHADRIKLVDILTNLISNADRLTRNSVVTLEIRRRVQFQEQKDARTEWLLFRIKDDSASRKADYKELFFDPLINADARRRRTVGPSVGLDLANKFSQMMGGEITAERASEDGWVIQLRLPAKVAEASAVLA